MYIQTSVSSVSLISEMSSNTVPLHVYYTFFNKQTELNNFHFSILPLLSSKNNLFVQLKSSLTFYGKHEKIIQPYHHWQRWYLQLAYEQYILGSISKDLLTLIFSGNTDHVGHELSSKNDWFKMQTMQKISSGIAISDDDQSKELLIAPFICFVDNQFSLFIDHLRFYTAADTNFISISGNGSLFYHDNTISNKGIGIGIDLVYLDQKLISPLNVALMIKNTGLYWQRLSNITFKIKDEIIFRGFNTSTFFTEGELTAYLDSLKEQTSLQTNNSIYQFTLPSLVSLSIYPNIDKGITLAFSFEHFIFDKLYQNVSLTPLYKNKDMVLGFPLAYRFTKNLGGGISYNFKSDYFAISSNFSVSFSRNFRYLTGFGLDLNIIIKL